MSKGLHQRGEGVIAGAWEEHAIAASYKTPTVFLTCLITDKNAVKCRIVLLNSTEVILFYFLFCVGVTLKIQNGCFN